jgi:cold shock CspA family protein
LNTTAGGGPGPAQRRGVVEEFDPVVGLGRIRGNDGTFEFHCTQIADGTRTIEVGTAVIFTVRAGRLGRWEAGGVTRTGSA